MMILYVLLALVLLGVMITVHEFGHYASARLCGIAVKEFSIGFGPKLFQRKSKKNDTLFSLRAIPLGGYCMFYGDTDDDPEGVKDDPRDYKKAAPWKRLISVVCGPLMNFVMAFIMAVVLCGVYGGDADVPVIYSVDSGMPAETAGLQPEDRIVSIADLSMQGKTAQDVVEALGSVQEDEPFEIVIERNKEQLKRSLSMQWDEVEERYRAGFVLSTAKKPWPISKVVTAAWEQCVLFGGMIAQTLGKLVTTGEGLGEASGPVGAVQVIAEQTRDNGLRGFLVLSTFLSVNLGLMNLLPIPGLDGSRVIFLLIEWIRGKPVKQKVEAVIHFCGYVFLILLMLYCTFKDVWRIFR